MPQGEKPVGAEEMKNKIVKSGDGKGKPRALPVRQAAQQLVSALPQPLSDEELFSMYDRTRNETFHTAGIESSHAEKNTVSAVVHIDQTITDGQNIRLRLVEPMLAGKTLIPENTILSGDSKIQGERLQITVNSLENNRNIIPVEITVYDTDGQCGIFIPDAKEINAAKEVAANMGTNAGTSISLSSDAGEQFAADMGRNLIQGASQFFSKKIREIKVHLKAGYRVYLLSGTAN
jgi:conjugative transposon TraM protein